ncbi:DUF4238 domain-containing protein [Lentzea sp. HUAS12]|uniref:DUF4238 domain-containing protein n=1 Tax=Lentzea sp. HUAS12 TaxID=2951806 RepID=UPI00209CF3F0|nr:DUF4238 domain-containing protein [Lentzea sp. HUAS12]USX54116.1 DUF4238 domain-containing protein [Lentzea sp. HUAS12]
MSERDVDGVGQRRKRHHFLPMSYLAGWADRGGQVAVRRRDRPLPFCASTRRVAVETDLYSVRTESGMDDSIEVALSEVERPLRGHLAELRDGRTPRKRTEIRKEVSFLIAIQLARTPEHMQRWTFPASAAEFTGESPVSREGMRRFLTEKHLGAPPSESELQGALDFANYILINGTPKKEELLELTFRAAREKLLPHLVEMAWAVEISRGPSFVTTDRPVAVWKHDRRALGWSGVGLGNADEVWFPLGPQHLLVLRPHYPEHRHVIGGERVAQVNRHLAAACHEFVIARPADEDVLAGITLKALRPAIRFNSAVLVGEDGVESNGQRMLHSYVPYDDGSD